MIWVAVAVMAGTVLFGLAWWSSGRSRSRYRSSADHEIAKGLGTAQGLTRNPPGSARGF